MKATELMIGDLIQHRGKVKKVVYINDRRDHLGHHNNEIAFTLDEDEWINAGWAEPIPLTKEIVFANEFQKNGQGVLVHKTDKQLKLYYDIDHYNGADWIVKEWSVCGVAGIKYVHEYQHYLRLVEKTDLADTFKI